MRANPDGLTNVYVTQFRAPYDKKVRFHVIINYAGHAFRGPNFRTKRHAEKAARRLRNLLGV